MEGGQIRKIIIPLSFVLLLSIIVACHVAPVVEYSSNIGASVGGKITYEGSFAPKITRDQTDYIARKWVQDYYHSFWAHAVNAKSYPINATVALFTGSPQQLPWKPPVTEYLDNLKVWVVVIKDLPYYGSGGPYDPRPFYIVSQANVVIDADTGKILFGALSGGKVYLDQNQ